MKKTYQPQLNKEASLICLGCMGFGDPALGQHKWTLDKEASREIIKDCLEAGINFFDTAPVYQEGTSETYLGQALKELAKREDVVIATKYMPRTPEEIAAGESVRDHIRKSLAGSLARLESDYADIFYLHKWDDTAPVEETMEALDELVKEGKVKALGLSNSFAYQLARANTIARSRGWTPFTYVQGHYNLIAREEEREMNRLCREEGIQLVPYSSLAAGRLARQRDNHSSRSELDAYARGKYAATEAQDQIIIDRVAELAAKKDVSMSEIALAWLIQKGCHPIAGATRPAQVADLKKAGDIILSEEEMKYLEEPYIPHALVGVLATI